MSQSEVTTLAMNLVLTILVSCRCPTLRLPRCNLYICIFNLELRQFLLLACAASITTVWAVFRNENWAWILQDILGILFR